MDAAAYLLGALNAIEAFSKSRGNGNAIEATPPTAIEVARRTPIEVADDDILDADYTENLKEIDDAVEAARAEVDAAGGVIARPELRILCKYLNMLGGVYILDSLPEGMIFQKIHDKAVEIARHKDDPAPDAAEDEPAGDDDEI